MAADQDPPNCPRCGNPTDRLRSLDPGRRLALQEAGQINLPDKVCPTCFEQLSASVSQGLKLRMERDVRDQNMMVMWKNRVSLIKTARGMMSQKAYSDAAVQYEKYLRLLEVVYSLKKGELSPKIFNNSSRSKELTVIASVYWDLMRIYDTSPRYGDRMANAARKLAEFLPFSTIYPDIIKKAEQFSRSAKNPNILRDFLHATQSTRGPCFIATAAFADEPYALELYTLRQFRDQKLRPYAIGRRLVWAYYRTSPPLARALGRHPQVVPSVRWLIVRLARVLRRDLKTVARLSTLNK